MMFSNESSKECDDFCMISHRMVMLVILLIVLLRAIVIIFIPYFVVSVAVFGLVEVVPQVL